MVEAYIGLGSNMGDRSGFLKYAINGLSSSEEVSVTAVSSIYKTDPVGPVSQDKYFNAVLCLETSLDPYGLLSLLLRIEKDCGRLRNERWGPRTLDLDILLFGDLEIEDASLKVPHPSMLERAFVLAPLAEIRPDIRIGNRLAREQLERIDSIGVERLIAFDQSKTVGIIGASSKPDRYSNRAQIKLMDLGHSVVPVSQRDGVILGVPCLGKIADYWEPVDTLTLYLSPHRQLQVMPELVAAKTKRVIFNPGTESMESKRQFETAGILTEEACTLVMLETGQF